MSHMDTTTIYRIEHSESKLGPWHCQIDEVVNSLYGEDFPDHSHPPPMFEYMIDHKGEKVEPGRIRDHVSNYGYHCGTDCLDMLRHWFGNGELIQTFWENSMELVKLTVPSEFVIIGDTQVIFDPNHILNREVMDMCVLID